MSKCQIWAIVGSIFQEIPMETPQNIQNCHIRPETETPGPTSSLLRIVTCPTLQYGGPDASNDLPCTETHWLYPICSYLSFESYAIKKSNKETNGSGWFWGSNFQEFRGWPRSEPSFCQESCRKSQLSRCCDYLKSSSGLIHSFPCQNTGPIPHIWTHLEFRTATLPTYA